MTIPRLGQGMPTNDGWVARMFADMQRQINELRSARSINKTTVDPDAPIVQEINKNAVPVGSVGGSLDTETFFSDTVTVYVSPDGNGALFACKLPGDAHPRWLLACDSEGGLYLTDGTVSPDHGINIYLSDNELLVIGARLQIGGHLLTFGGMIGDPTIGGSAPDAVGVRGLTTAGRLALTITTSDHYMVFDTDLGKPVWSNGSGGWVDATGATV